MYIFFALGGAVMPAWFDVTDVPITSVSLICSMSFFVKSEIVLLHYKSIMDSIHKRVFLYQQCTSLLSSYLFQRNNEQ